MAMNWGAFAGAAASNALNTYERLGEEELRDMQRKKLRQDMAQEAALDKLYAETQGRVGQQDEYGQAIKTGAAIGTEQAQMLSNQGALRGNTAEDQAFEKASAEAAAGAMRENAVRQGAIPEAKAALPEMQPTEYTQRQGTRDFVKGAAAIGVKPAMQAMQMGTAMREYDNQLKFDDEKTKLDDTLARIHGIGESQGLKGLADAANKEGLKVKFVEGKNGVGSRIQVLGPKGDVLETVSDIGSATEKLSQAAMQQFYTKSVGLLGSADKVIAAMQGERKLNIAQQEADTNKEFRRGYINSLNAKSKSFTDKLPEKDKFKLNSLNSAVQTSLKAFEANPTPEGQLRVGVNQLKLNKAMKSYGMVEDIYEGTGIPSPQEAAGQIIANKITNKAEIEKRLSVASQTFGRDYADEVALALRENAPVKPGKPSAALPNEPTSRVKSIFEKPALTGELPTLPENVRGIRAFGRSPETE